jgi:hypothetical protein
MPVQNGARTALFHPVEMGQILPVGSPDRGQLGSVTHQPHAYEQS